MGFFTGTLLNLLFLGAIIFSLSVLVGLTWWLIRWCLLKPHRSQTVASKAPEPFIRPGDSFLPSNFWQFPSNRTNAPIPLPSVQPRSSVANSPRPLQQSPNPHRSRMTR